MNTVQTRFVLRFDDNSNWEKVKNTTILLKGEPAFEFFTDNNVKMKVGDGISTWAELQYLTGGSASEIDPSNLGLLFQDNKLYLTNKGEPYSEPVEIKTNSVNGLFYEDNQLYLTVDGETIGDPVEITGGSGAPSGTYNITLTNKLDQRVFSIAKDDSAIIKFLYKSVDSVGIDDGPGIGTVLVGGVKKTSFNVIQGENSIDITNYLQDGTQTVQITVTNSENNKRTLVYQITVLNLSIECSLPTLGLYSSSIAIQYIIRGQGNKIVHYLIDGNEHSSEEVNVSGISKTFSISGLTNGAHLLEFYADAQIDGQTLESNHIKLGLLVTSNTMTDPAVIINYNGTEITQGNTLIIPYLAYAPNASSVETTLNVYNSDGSLYSSKTIIIGFTPQNWALQNFPQGNDIKFEIVVGNDNNKVSQSITLKVLPSDFNKEIISVDKVLEFTAANRSNNEENPASWTQGDIIASFDGFGWSNADGWLEDEDGITVLRFLPGDNMVIPFQPFKSAELANTGITIEAEIATHNVRDYDSIILEASQDAENGGIGFVIRSQSAEYNTALHTTKIQFKEDSKVRICFSVEPKTLNRFIYTYINGVMCGVIQYTDGEQLYQNENLLSNITIGANSCGLDLYTLRIYNRALARSEQLNNFIVDRPNLVERKAADQRNDVLNGGQVVPDSLPLSIPKLIISSASLPSAKGQKVIVDIAYTDGLNPDRSYTAQGATLSVQGTSSQYYPIKNYKIKFSNGIVYSSGQTAEGWPVEPDRLISKCICVKADFASSENANNTCLAAYYDDLIPYKVPPQNDDPLIQTTVRGIPIVIFWNNTDTNEISFLGKYNANYDKSNENVFGFDRTKYPRLECWEFLNNISKRTLFQSDDFESTTDGTPDWLNDFEARFPEEDDNGNPYQDSTQLKRLFQWIASTDRNAVSTEAEKAARLKKFKDEFDNYLIKEPCLFYYIFTEVFLMVDSRAKNLFLTFWGSDGEKSDERWMPYCYDLDTAIGIEYWSH